MIISDQTKLSEAKTKSDETKIYSQDMLSFQLKLKHHQLLSIAHLVIRNFIQLHLMFQHSPIPALDIVFSWLALIIKLKKTPTNNKPMCRQQSIVLFHNTSRNGWWRVNFKTKFGFLSGIHGFETLLFVFNHCTVALASFAFTSPR